MSLPLACALTLTYLGVAGWKLDDGKHVVLTDPYFSRAAGDGPIASSPRAVAAYSPEQADVILIGHSHHDHLLDAPAVAKRTGALLVGSPSTARVAKAAGLTDRYVKVVNGGDSFDVDGVAVRVIPSLHAILDDKPESGADSAIPPGVKLPMPASAYKDGGTLAYLVTLDGRKLLIFDTANFIERALAGIHPDVVIVATGMRERVPDYSCRLMKALGRPAVVVATHFDDFQAPPGTPLDKDRREAAQRFADEIRACAPGTKVVIPEAFRPFSL